MPHCGWITSWGADQRVVKNPDDAEAVTQDAVRTLGCSAESVDIVFDDVKKSDWASAGRLASDPK